MDRLDLGGGLGIVYRDEVPPPPTDYADIVRDVFGDMGVELTFEPGRRLAGEAGILVTEVIYMKESGGRSFAVVDAAMNDLIRPTLYEAWHDIDPEAEPNSGAALSPVDIVGPVCETGDFLGKGRNLLLDEGDLLAVRSAGAYAYVMASNYNSKTRAAEVLIENGEAKLIRQREQFEDLTRGEIIPA